MIRINKNIFSNISNISYISDISNIFKNISLLIVIIVMSSITARASTNTALANEFKLESGIYIFVSFSMKDEALRAYFKEAQNHGATLVIRGFVNDSTSSNKNHNRFAATKARIEKARINIDINPNLFEQINVNQVPVIAVVDNNGNIKKISGHITLEKALEYMDVKDKIKQNKIKQTHQVITQKVG